METETQESELVGDFTWPTLRGDVLLRWGAGWVQVDARLATDKERAELEAWAKKHKLKRRGSLDSEATYKGKVAVVYGAVDALLREQVGAPGYAMFVLTDDGERKVVQHKEEMPPAGKVKKAAKVPQTAGG